MLEDRGPFRIKTHERCLLCGGALRVRYTSVPDRLGTSSGEYQLDECRSCGLGLINPAPSGDLSQYYPDRYLSQESGDAETAQGVLSQAERLYRYDQYRFDFSLLERACGKPLGESTAYLDVGCGSGERVSYVSERGCQRAVGIDRFAFGKASPRREVELLNSEIVDFRPSEKFDVVSMFHVLEHVENPVEVLRHLREHVVSDSGSIIVQVPNYGSFERRVFGRRWFGLDAPRHLIQFNARNIQIALQACGFEITRLYCVNAPLHPVTFVPSLFPSLDVQRIWVSEWSATRKIMAQCLWAAVTLAVLPVNWLLNLVRSGSMLTVVAKPVSVRRTDAGAVSVDAALRQE